MTGIITVARAHLIQDGDDARLTAWAEHHVRKDEDIGWILGNFVEADNYNSNGHLFPRAELETYGVHTVASKSLNMIHHERYIVGAFAAGNMLYPDEAAVASAAAAGEPAPNPHMEALSGMWRKLFPDEYGLVQRAHKEGTLFYSMESTPQTLTCPDCAGVYKFKGLQHEDYCEHLNASRVSKKQLDMAHFNAGALIIPPVQPGWSRADIKTLAESVAADPEGSEALYASFEQEAPHLGPDAWEHLMGMVILAGVEARHAEASGVSVPEFVRKNARRGLEYLKQGGGGDGLRPATIADARRMAEGSVSEAKVRRIGPWIARHMVDLDAPQNSNRDDPQYPGNGLVAMLLWGAGPDKQGARRTQDWAERESAKLLDDE